MFINHQKYELRSEIKQMLIAGVEEQDLTFFEFSPEESTAVLEWLHPGEFSHKGELYDVVRIDTVGDTVRIWCWWDREESRLHKTLDKLVNKAMGGDRESNDSKDRLLTFFKNLYTPVSYNFRLCPVQISEERTWPYDLIYSSFIPLPPTPPPRSG